MLPALTTPVVEVFPLNADRYMRAYVVSYLIFALVMLFLTGGLGVILFFIMPLAVVTTRRNLSQSKGHPHPRPPLRHQFTSPPPPSSSIPSQPSASAARPTPHPSSPSSTPPLPTQTKPPPPCSSVVNVTMGSPSCGVQGTESVIVRWQGGMRDEYGDFIPLNVHALDVCALKKLANSF
jgi:hypothetical protein